MKRLLSVSVVLLHLTLIADAQDLTKAQAAAERDRQSVARRTQIAKQGATIWGDRGTFTVSSTEVLNRGQFSLGAAWSNTDRNPKDIDINSFPVHFSYGLSTRMTVSGMVEVHKQITARQPGAAGFYGELPFVSTGYQKGLGDTVLTVKYRLQRKADNTSGIALKGIVRFGTADSDKGLGTKRTDAGAELLFTSLLPLKFLMNSSMGYMVTTNTKQPSVQTMRDQMKAGIGAVWPSSGIGLGAARLQAIAEYTSLTFVGCCSSANAATAKTQNPTDVTAGLRLLFLNQGLTLDAGYRVNSKFQLSGAKRDTRAGVVAGITFTRPDSAGLTSNRQPLVVLETDNAQIAANGAATITATGFDADNDKLNYAWSSTGGQVTGSDSSATFRAAGAAPGRYLVKVVASDGHGGSATAEIEITVR